MTAAPHHLPLFLGSVLLLGCGGRGSAPPTKSPLDAASGAVGGELASKVGEALGDALSKKIEEIEAKSVTIHILNYVPDDLKTIQDKLKSLLPAENNSVGYQNRFLEGVDDQYVYEFTAAPVDDIPAFAARITFGAVLAVDPEKRAILLDYGKDPTSQSTWRDGAFLADKLEQTAIDSRLDVLAREFANSLDYLAKNHPLEEIAAIVIDAGAQDPETEFGPHLRKAANPDAPDSVAYTGWHWSTERATTVMWVGKDLEAFAGRLDFARVKCIDAKRRLLILGVDSPASPEAISPPATEPSPADPPPAPAPTRGPQRPAGT
jgi:hypothetical protein